MMLVKHFYPQLMQYDCQSHSRFFKGLITFPFEFVIICGTPVELSL